MNQGPLTEKELNWLEDMLEKYGNEHAVVDTAELDGMLTALLSGPNDIEPSEWLVAMWGGKKHIPKWSNEREMDRFMTLTFQHLNDIAERLAEFPEQFDPLFGTQEMEGQEFTVVEDWCYGYLRGRRAGCGLVAAAGVTAADDGGDHPARQRRAAGAARSLHARRV